MEKIELPIRLRKRPWKNIGLLIISSAFVAIGCSMIRDKDQFGPACAFVGVFGMGVIMAAMELLTDCTYLEISEQGFVCCTFFRRRELLAWYKIAGFGLIKKTMHVGLHGPNLPVVNVAYALKVEPGKLPKKFRLANLGLEGWDGVLPGSYGMRPEKLLEFMTFMAAEYGGGGEPE